MKNQTAPPVTASISTRLTKSGKAILKVRLITPHDVQYRTYPVSSDATATPPETLIRNALKSAGLTAAWYQAGLW